MNRSEFTAKTKDAAHDRSGGKCERCGAPLATGAIEYDHIIACELGGSNSLQNCMCVCRACHSTKTRKQDAPAIAKAKRRKRRHVGIKQPTKFRGWKKMDGTVVYANRKA